MRVCCEERLGLSFLSCVDFGCFDDWFGYGYWRGGEKIEIKVGVFFVFF